MRMPKTIPASVLPVVLASAVWLSVPSLTLAAEEHEHPVPEKLGSVTFPTSCSPAHQKEFERAVALLHSFAYSAAQKAFSDLLGKDPDCAMAHWGLAMTYFHPLWEPHFIEQGIPRGQSEVQRAKAGKTSDIERGFIEALEKLYANADSVKYPERVGAYSTAMGELARRNPNNVECQVFYALSLLAIASPADKTHASEKKAVDILEPLFKQYPDHPGIPHYLIHACDNPEMAFRGKTAAQKYAEIAPSAPHALHMPSHIYTRLGMWERSITSNLAARKAARDQGDIGEELHAMDYLTYAYLQVGGDEHASRLLEDLRNMPKANSYEFKVGYATTAMPVRYVLERKQWAEASRLEPMPGAQPQIYAITIWARAVGNARNGNAAAARVETDDLKTAYDKLVAAGDDYWATLVHAQWNEARAWIAHAEKKDDDAVKLMREAADEEDSVEKRPVTPGAIIPAREQLGELLMELNRPKDALPEFQKSLTMTPNRHNAVYGRDQAQDLVNTGGKVEED